MSASLLASNFAIPTNAMKIAPNNVVNGTSKPESGIVGAFQRLGKLTVSGINVGTHVIVGAAIGVGSLHIVESAIIGAICGGAVGFISGANTDKYPKNE